MLDETLLKREEKAMLALRSLYRRYGYRPFRMSRFEEYEFYMRNKDYLESGRIITFTDTDGKLMALKPDVTLSIIKNGVDEPGCRQKVYYDESVFRVPAGGQQFREIRQAGLECIGEIRLYDVYEVLLLAAESLGAISDRFVLDLSHLGILSALLEETGQEESFRRRAAACFGSKNAHDLRDLCLSREVSPAVTERLCRCAALSGPLPETVRELEGICPPGAADCLEELRTLSRLLGETPWGERISLDFSVVNNMGYYSGIVFSGFLEGIVDPVLSGGRYDRLMHKLGRRSGAIGFAVYLDLLNSLRSDGPEGDPDILLLIPGDADPERVARAVGKLTAAGGSVSVQERIPAVGGYGKCLRLEEVEPC